MIFAVETEDKAPTDLRTEGDVVAHCEGLDVEAAIWSFRGAEGSPLGAQFIAPNKRGWLSVQSGACRLVPASPKIHAHLAEAPDGILRLEPAPFFKSRLQVREHLVQDGIGTS